MVKFFFFFVTLVLALNFSMPMLASAKKVDIEKYTCEEFIADKETDQALIMAYTTGAIMAILKNQDPFDMKQQQSAIKKTVAACQASKDKLFIEVSMKVLKPLFLK